MQHSASLNRRMCHHSNPRVSPLDCAHAPSQWHNNQPAGWCTCHYNKASASWATHIYDHSTQSAGMCTSMITALSQLDCEHLWSQLHSTQPAGMCISMITEPQHLASWTVHIYDHSSTALSQLDCAHLWSQNHSTQPTGLCMCAITEETEHFNRACTSVLTCHPWLCLFLFFSYFYTFT